MAISPLNKGAYKYNETEIYKMIRDEGYSVAAACGILANIEAESGFNPENLQDIHENATDADIRYTSDKAYTRAFDEVLPYIYNTDPRSIAFVNSIIEDGAGYGLCQWTYSSRKKNLAYYFAKGIEYPSVGSYDKQVEFMFHELRTDVAYNINVLSKIKDKSRDNVEGAKEIAEVFCKEYLKPQSSEEKAKERSIRAAEYYNHYSGEEKKKENLEDLIYMNVVGKPYNSKRPVIEDILEIIGISLPEQELGYLLYDSLLAHEDWIEVTSTDSDAYKSGDILFFSKGGSNYYDYYGVWSGPTKKKVIALYGSYPDAIADSLNLSDITSIYTDPYVVFRHKSIVDSGGSGESNEYSDPGLDAPEYISLTSNDPYSLIASYNLQKIETTNFDYGYLIDMSDTGRVNGYFKFYVPEFTEQAGADWEDIDIRGRSVQVKSYNSTKSRTITISLDLYAGVGIYTPRISIGETGKDAVSRLHADANFLKSLEYPDYSNAIVTPPHTVHLVLGPHINLIGVVSGVTVNHLKPLDPENRSMYLKVSFTVSQIAPNPPDYRDIREGKYTVVDSDTILESSTNAPVHVEGDEVTN